MNRIRGAAGTEGRNYRGLSVRGKKLSFFSRGFPRLGKSHRFCSFFSFLSIFYVIYI